MKNLSKYTVLLAALVAMPAFASDITVKDTTSPEFIQNQGYSAELSRIIEVKTKDLATPLPTEKPSFWKRFGWYATETIDPSVNRPGKFVNHDIKYHPSIDDL